MPALPENRLMHYTVTAQKSLFNGSMLVFFYVFVIIKKVRILIVLIILLILSLY